MSGLDPPRKSRARKGEKMNGMAKEWRRDALTGDGTAQCCRDGTSKGLATTG